MWIYYGCGNHFDYRSLACLVFSFFYLVLLIWNIYVYPFELVSDLENYSNHYYYGTIGEFGLEVVLPAIFYMTRSAGLSFYDMVFVLGVLYLWPIMVMARFVRVKYLVFYFGFYFIFFIPNYAFLMRQYFSFFMFVLFASGKGRPSFYPFLLLSLFSHLSAILWLAVLFLRRKKITPYLSFLSIGIYLMSFFGFSLMDYLLDIMAILAQVSSSTDFARKINGMMMYSDFSGGSVRVYFVLCVTVFLHAVHMMKTGDSHPILTIMFFGSCFALIFSQSAVVSNRIGFAGYFFSLPYLCMVASGFWVSSDVRLMVRRAPVSQGIR